MSVDRHYPSEMERAYRADQDRLNRLRFLALTLRGEARDVAAGRREVLEAAAVACDEEMATIVQRWD